MKTQKRNLARWSLALALIFTGLGVVSVFSWARPTLSAKQEWRDRTIRRLPIERNEPIAIAHVKVKGKSVSRNRKFLSDDDWLNGLTIRVKNRSDKEILFASIQLQFPRTSGVAGRIAVDDIDYGNRALLTRPPTAPESSAAIAPGQTVDIQLNSLEHDLLRNLLNQTGYPAGVDELHLRVGRIIFADDTMWYAGSHFQRDPDDPASWINAELADAAKRNSAVPILAVKSALPQRADKSLKNHGAERNYWFFRHGSDSSIEQLFVKASYGGVMPQSGCKTLFRNSVHECSWDYIACNYPYDLLGTEAGNYFLAAASGLCKGAGGASCNHYQNTNIANSCSTGGGGGGGGGTEGGGCWSDWDCFAGEECEGGTCQEYGGGYGGLQPE